MTLPRLLVVVDDNRKFAVHVWRQLTGAMEFGFKDDARGPFQRRSADGSLEVCWHDPRHVEGSAPLDSYEKTIDRSDVEVWSIIDVRGVDSRGEGPDGWLEYFRAFERKLATTERVRVISSFGARGWGAEPRVHPKTVETLRELRSAMRLPDPLPKPTLRDKAVKPRDVNVLITGAGFELKELTRSEAGVVVGFPKTGDLLWSMKPSGVLVGNIDDQRRPYPVPVSCNRVKTAAESERLDDYWDAVLDFFSRNDLKPAAARQEVAYREAFRRAMLAHDFGHQIQALAAARLDWDYWLTTNYTRFADRAIDLVTDIGSRPAPWRAITTPIEADAVAPFVSHEDLALEHRVLVKLHGDIGHTWTMALAGQDKLADSKLFVRPQLHRMYAVAEAMLLESLWRRNADVCTWYVVGHGLWDASLLRLIGRVVLRSSHTRHRLILSAPRRESGRAAATRGEHARHAWLVERFIQAGEPELARRLFAASRDESLLRVHDAPCSALDFMSQLSEKGLQLELDPTSESLSSFRPTLAS